MRCALIWFLVSWNAAAGFLPDVKIQIQNKLRSNNIHLAKVGDFEQLALLDNVFIVVDNSKSMEIAKKPIYDWIRVVVDVLLTVRDKVDMIYINDEYQSSSMEGRRFSSMEGRRFSLERPNPELNEGIQVTSKKTSTTWDKHHYTFADSSKYWDVLDYLKADAVSKSVMVILLTDGAPHPHIYKGNGPEELQNELNGILDAEAGWSFSLVSFGTNDEWMTLFDQTSTRVDVTLRCEKEMEIIKNFGHIKEKFGMGDCQIKPALATISLFWDCLNEECKEFWNSPENTIQIFWASMQNAGLQTFTPVELQRPGRCQKLLEAVSGTEVWREDLTIAQEFDVVNDARLIVDDAISVVLFDKDAKRLSDGKGEKLPSGVGPADVASYAFRRYHPKLLTAKRQYIIASRKDGTCSSDAATSIEDKAELCVTSVDDSVIKKTVGIYSIDNDRGKQCVVTIKFGDILHDLVMLLFSEEQCKYYQQYSYNDLIVNNFDTKEPVGQDFFIQDKFLVTSSSGMVFGSKIKITIQDETGTETKLEMPASAAVQDLLVKLKAEKGDEFVSQKWLYKQACSSTVLVRPLMEDIKDGSKFFLCKKRPETRQITAWIVDDGAAASEESKRMLDIPDRFAILRDIKMAVAKDDEFVKKFSSRYWLTEHLKISARSTDSCPKLTNEGLVPKVFDPDLAKLDQINDFCVFLPAAPNDEDVRRWTASVAKDRVNLDSPKSDKGNLMEPLIVIGCTALLILAVFFLLCFCSSTRMTQDEKELLKQHQDKMSTEKSDEPLPFFYSSEMQVREHGAASKNE